MRRHNLFASDDAKVTWICDSKTGCKAAVSTNGDVPEGWLTTVIKRDGGPVLYASSFELCPECAEKTKRFIQKACEVVPRAVPATVQRDARKDWCTELRGTVEELMTAQVDVELWDRFIDKIIEQTVAGTLIWEPHHTPEYNRYFVCAVRDHALYFWPLRKTVELVGADDRRRWTVTISPVERLTRFVTALGDQLTPKHMEAVQRFAREFLGEEP